MLASVKMSPQEFHRYWGESTCRWWAREAKTQLAPVIFRDQLSTSWCLLNQKKNNRPLTRSTEVLFTQLLLALRQHLQRGRRQEYCQSLWLSLKRTWQSELITSHHTISSTMTSWPPESHICNTEHNCNLRVNSIENKMFIWKPKQYVPWDLRLTLKSLTLYNIII